MLQACCAVPTLHVDLAGVALTGPKICVVTVLTGTGTPTTLVNTKDSVSLLVCSVGFLKCFNPLKFVISSMLCEFVISNILCGVVWWWYGYYIYI